MECDKEGAQFHELTPDHGRIVEMDHRESRPPELRVGLHVLDS